MCVWRYRGGCVCVCEFGLEQTGAQLGNPEEGCLQKELMHSALAMSIWRHMGHLGTKEPGQHYRPTYQGFVQDR